ncbi:S-layer homology domain-containing protein [Megasphaera elsdenii]|uniref:S-layer homology domain-containing protein n=1 Tax=Megasphaera elsdenii TaxID=907 RepID=UPI0008E6EE4D|nr:S-layer homology domain-containing protein [Megasphaera elsdenii]SFI33333.1 S-layer homology domain-containing protein [Megasphaera elsdenii]
MKKQVVCTLTAALAVTSLSALAANPFVDVPSDSWAYKSVVELADAGIIQGVDGQYFQGHRNITRYEAAEMVAKAMAHMDKASVEQRALINKLADEYADELNSLGVRVTNLENRVGHTRVFGDVFVRYRYQNGNKKNDSSWDTRFRIRAQGQVNDRTKVTAGVSTGFRPFASNGAASDEGNNPYVDLAKVDYNFGSKNWELSVGRNDVYRIGRDAYGLQYFDALDGAELRYHNDKLAITTGYGKFKDGKKPGVDTVKPISDAHSDHFSTDGLKTGYGEIDAFFGGGKAARSEAGIYYNRLHQSNHGKDADKDYFAKYIAGYFARGNYGKWSLLANYEHIGFKDGVKNVDGQDYGDAWMYKLQYGNASFAAPGSWDTWLEYLDLDDGSFLGGNPFTWRFSSDMDNQRTWGIGADYTVAKNLKFSVMQSFASQAKTGSQDPHEMTRIHFQMLF